MVSLITKLGLIKCNLLEEPIYLISIFVLSLYIRVILKTNEIWLLLTIQSFGLKDSLSCSNKKSSIVNVFLISISVRNINVEGNGFCETSVIGYI